MSDKGVVLFLSEVLGNKSMSRRLREAMVELGVPVACEVSVTPADFRALSPWQRKSRGTSGETIAAARAALARTALPSGAAVLANGWEFALAAAHDSRVARVAFAMDTVPSHLTLKSAGWLDNGAMRSALRLLSAWVHSRDFLTVATRFVALLPMSQMAANEACRLLGRTPECVRVTFSPQQMIAAVPNRVSDIGCLRALFVGNDLARKGGALFGSAVQAASAHGDISGTIVSQDPQAMQLAEEFGLACISSLSDARQIHEVYRNHDLLVLPTQRDFMPNVIAESLAAGTPVLATPVGAIPELVIPGETGWLMSRNPGTEQLSRHLIDIANSPARAQMSSTALHFARRELGWTAFVEKVSDACTSLLQTPPISG